MRVITYILLIIVVLVGITFTCLNADPVRINYYIGSRILPLSLLLIITLIVGGILGYVAGLIFLLKQKCENRRLSHRVRLAEKEIANLRTIPLKDDR